MSKAKAERRRSKTASDPKAQWDAIAALLAKMLPNALIEQVDELRRAPSLPTPAQVLNHLKQHGASSASPGVGHNILTSLLDVVASSHPEKAAARDLSQILMIYQIAMDDAELVKRAAEAAKPAATEQAKGSEPMTDIEKHAAALRAALGDEAAFRAAVAALFSDDALSAADRKQVVAEVTGAPARRLSSDSARKDELERWSAAKARASNRSAERMAETSRF